MTPIQLMMKYNLTKAEFDLIKSWLLSSSVPTSQSIQVLCAFKKLTVEQAMLVTQAIKHTDDWDG